MAGLRELGEAIDSTHRLGYGDGRCGKLARIGADFILEHYWDVFTRFVNMAAGGEWYERLDRQGVIIDDALGHNWKISYHTVRGMVQVVRRLRSLSD